MIETEIKVTPQIAAEHGLSPEEYARTQKYWGAIRLLRSWEFSA